MVCQQFSPTAENASNSSTVASKPGRDKGEVGGGAVSWRGIWPRQALVS